MRSLISRWKERRKCEVRQDGEVTMGDIVEVCSTLACIIAHQEYLAGGMPRVERALEQLVDLAKLHLVQLILDDVNIQDLYKIS